MNPRWSIRTRVLAIALLPALCIALPLGGLLSWLRYHDTEMNLDERGIAIARQLAPASEFGVFSGNRDVLGRLAESALAEADVVGVSISDNSGRVAVLSQRPGYLAGADGRPARGNQDVRTYAAPVMPSILRVEDFPDAAAGPRLSGLERPEPIGLVQVQLSRRSMLLRQRQQLEFALAMGVACMLAIVMLALWLSREVIGSITAMADVVARLAAGALETRVPETSSSELGILQRGINRMADRMRVTQDDLRSRIDAATDALRTQKQVAEQAAASKSRFLAAASHDLRQPLQAMQLFIEALRLQLEAPESRRLLDYVEASAGSMTELLNGVLDLSRLEAGVLQPEFRPVPLALLMDQVARSFSLQAQAKGLRLRVVRTQAVVRADPVLLETMMMNLVANAVRYTREGGIVIGCRRPRAGCVRLEVWDSGVGVSGSQRRLIFEEFYQVDNPQRDRSHGLGLGLAIVRGLADLMDIHVDLRSRLGKGSVFSLELPVADPADAKVMADTVAPLAASHLDGARVLVMDDDPDVRAGLASNLVAWGCVCLPAATLEEAVELLRQSAPMEPDLVLADYRLPGELTGIGAVAALRERCTGPLLAVLLTGDTGPDVMAAAVASGLPLLHKPIQPAKLRALVNSVLSRRPPR